MIGPTHALALSCARAEESKLLLQMHSLPSYPIGPLHFSRRLGGLKGFLTAASPMKEVCRLLAQASCLSSFVIGAGARLGGEKAIHMWPLEGDALLEMRGMRVEERERLSAL